MIFIVVEILADFFLLLYPTLTSLDRFYHGWWLGVFLFSFLGSINSLYLRFGHHDIVGKLLCCSILTEDGYSITFVLHVDTQEVLSPHEISFLGHNSEILPINPKRNSPLVHVEIYRDDGAGFYPLIGIMFILFGTVKACHTIFAIKPTGKLSLSVVSAVIFESLSDTYANTAIFVVLFAKF